MRLQYADGNFTTQLNAIKQDIFGRSDFSLHRSEILAAAAPPFDVLKNDATRTRFDNAILTLIDAATYRVVTVIIDKKEHKEKYTIWLFQPYHYCMTVLLERYGLLLNANNATGDVMAESRGKKENKQLAKAYRYIYRNGTDNLKADFFQAWLSSKEIKISKKSDNVAGLQLADLIANPSCRDLICTRTNTVMTAPFSKKVVEILFRKKYRRSRSGVVQGWGTKWLP